MITCHKKYLIARCRQRGYTLEDVLPCVAARDGDMWTIDVDHPAYPNAKPSSTTGPGTELKALLAKFGIHASPTCGCNAMARKMDAWGPDESLKHLEEIVDVMEETAKKRNLPFIRSAGRLLVRRAISKSRAMISKGGQ